MSPFVVRRSRQTARDTDTDGVGPREVLLAAWFLSRRNLLLVLWHWLSGMAASMLALATALVIVVALLLPARAHEMSTLLGWLGYGADLFERVRQPAFVFSLAGLLATAVALHIAITAFVQGGVYGRLAHALKPDGHKAGFWRSGVRWFAPMVGLTALRMVLEIALGVVAAILVGWPLVLGLEHVALTDQIPVPHALFAAVGAATSVVLWALVWTWRMSALGPLMLEERSLFEALGDAGLHLGEHLWRWLRLLGGCVLLLAPVVLVYGAFAIMLVGLSADPRMSAVVLLGQLTLDTAFALAMSLAFVLFAAAFLVQYAWRERLITELPGASAPAPAAAAPWSGARAPLRFGQPMAIPGVPALVVMPMPTRHPNIVRFDDLLAPSGSDAPADEPRPGDPGQPVPGEEDEPPPSEPASE